MFDGSIRDHAHLTPRAIAVITPRRRLTYAEFDREIDRFGAALSEMGVGPETGVVSIAMDDPELTYVLLAALARLRVATSPYHDPGASVRLTEDRPRAGAEAPGPRLVRLTNDWIAAARARPHVALPRLPIDPDGLGRVMLSSGTTRTPRRIAMTWRRMQAINMANFAGRGAGVHGVWAPLTTVEAIQGFSMAVSAWTQGAALAGGFRASDVAGLMEGWPTGLVGCTPTQLRQLLGALPLDFQPRTGWRISVGGARLPVSLAREARLRLTSDVRITYGATEATFNTLGLAAGLDDDPGYVGVPVNGAIVEILGDDGQPVADGVSGEIRIRGDRVADGYLDDPAATAERFRDGWFFTRDVGRRMPDGRIVLEGRVDDRMILADLGKFMPSVLEDAAMKCPGVIDCAAFAVPDSDGLDLCWLAVVTEPGFDRDALAGHLARYRGLPPSRLAWIEEIPRNAMGKAQRDLLRKALMAATQGRTEA